MKSEMGLLFKLAQIFVILTFSLQCGTFVGNPEEDGGDPTPTTDNPSDPGAIVEEGEIPPKENDVIKPLEEPIYNPKTGVSFFLTDAPIDDAANVFIQVAMLKLKADQGLWIELPAIATEAIDLLSLQNGKAIKLAESATIPDGTYKELRMVLAADVDPKLVLADGSEHILKIPSADASGIKIDGQFTVAADEPQNFIIDFDLRKSIKSVGKKQYKLDPRLKVLSTKETGVITGQAAEGGIACAYAKGIEPDSTADCENAENSSSIKSGNFTLAFLPAGKYVVKIFNEDGTETISQIIDVKKGQTSGL